METAYKQHATQERKTFSKRKKMWVSCTECGVIVAALYLMAHMEKIHGICAPQTRGVDKVGGGATTYMVSFTRVFQEVKCPVTIFPVVDHSAGKIREHFMYHYFWSKVAVFQQGDKTLPRCDFCGMHMEVGRLIKHQRTASCDKNTHMQRQRRDVAIADRCSEENFSLIGEEEAE